MTEVQEALNNLPINQSNPCETLDSGILILEQCLNEQAPIKKNRLYRALVLVVKRPMQSIKSTGIKLLIYWKSTKKLLSVTILVLSQ